MYYSATAARVLATTNLSFDSLFPLRAPVSDFFPLKWSNPMDASNSTERSTASNSSRPKLFRFSLKSLLLLMLLAGAFSAGWVSHRSYLAWQNEKNLEELKHDVEISVWDGDLMILKGSAADVAKTQKLITVIEAKVNEKAD